MHLLSILTIQTKKTFLFELFPRCFSGKAAQTDLKQHNTLLQIAIELTQIVTLNHKAKNFSVFIYI